MPTDGADFDGADDADVAECVMRGVELDIRRDGGAPAYPVAVDLLTLASSGGLSGQKLLAGVDAIRKDFVDSPLARHFAAAVETIGLSAIAEGRSFSREQAARRLLVQADSLAACLRAKKPWPALCAKWPDLLRTEIELDSTVFRESVINLLCRHVDEWRSFSSAIYTDSVALAA